ncbi:MAG: glycerophosphodiester phosphodiesterase family protein [Candidatus Izemoplasmatales bacterium]|uniref:Glycerophosphodiester phosphodiesterase n=1 Tax=Hujiaoplasma nucleasis TaxID=2725268 RepID=A0A7L6N764_9MOLU|nr:glycerophosphodiester phosphodiesterase family protein [Hujiaoplasma nucleasis]QLY40374.1 glycerophosphodiester phosphodiesterase [Hujiaoplasma nucleasis]
MKDLTWIKDNFIAHRGFHSLDKSIPENTLIAFKRAIDYKYGIELDVNVTKDGKVVVFHDLNLKRMCKVDIDLDEVTYDEIKEFRILNTNEKIPLLSDVLQLVKGKVPLLIELKPKGDNKLLCEAFMKTMTNYKGNYAIHSFSPWIVKWFKKNHPDVIRGQIAEFFKNDSNMNPFIKYLMKSMFFNHFTKPDFINYGIKDLPNKYATKAHQKGICVISYCARNNLEFNLVKKHYDNAVFEFFRPEYEKR